MEPEVNKPPLNLVVPCYNPPDQWSDQLIDSVLELSKLIGFQPKVVLVNDGSTKGVDSSHISVLEEKLENFQYIQYAQNKGKGHALRTGVDTCKEGLVIYTDIDFPYTVESMSDIYNALCAGVDLASGFRESTYYENVPWFRKVLSKFVRGLLKYILRLKVSDTQCGLKGFNQKGRTVFLKTSINRFLFDMEFITLASGKNGVNVAPVNVYLRPDVEFGRMNMWILLTESGNFVKVVVKKWFGRI